MKQKSIAIVNDISGFGRCSVTVALPILSAMKLQCGIVPTAILSNQTEYPEYTMLDFTDYMECYLDTWQRLGFSFDGIYTGFLGSTRQLAIIEKMMDTFSFEEIIVDPVMGDQGTLYSSYTPDMCDSMKKLVGHATLITPNVTELCILTGTPYRKHFLPEEIKEMCQLLCKSNSFSIVVTGIEQENQIGNAIYEKEHFEILWEKKILPLRPGTGDVFASILAGYELHHVPLRNAVISASSFVRSCLESSAKMDIPINDGVCFEEHLLSLCTDIQNII